MLVPSLDYSDAYVGPGIGVGSTCCKGGSIKSRCECEVGVTVKGKVKGVGGGL